MSQEIEISVTGAPVDTTPQVTAAESVENQGLVDSGNAEVKSEPEVEASVQGEEIKGEENKSKDERRAEGKRVERKIDRLYKDRAEAQNRALKAEQELEALKKYVEEQKSKKVDLDELSFDDRVAHVASEKIQEQQLEAQKKHLESEIASVKEYEWQEKLDASLDLMPDYFETIKSATPLFNALPVMVQEAVVESEHGPLLAYELAKNPEIALKLRTANPLSAAQTLLKLEAKIESRLAETKAPVQQVQAPKVQSTPSVANTAPAQVTNFWELPMEEIMRQSKSRGSRFR